MPPLPPYPGVLRVTTPFAISSDVSVGTTLHFAYTGTPPSDATCVTLANDIEALGVTNLVPLLQADTSLLGAIVLDLSSSTGGTGQNNTHTGGTRGTALLSAATCALQSMKIARRYRGGKPRAYWPFGEATDLSSPQAWSGAAITAFTNGLSTYITDISALSVGGTILGGLVNISYYSGFTTVLNPVTGRTRDVPKVRAVAIAPDPILSWEISPNIATQRRRSQTI